MAVCVAGAALLAVSQAAREAQYPFQLDYEEGNILNAGVRITHGLSAYPDPLTYPNALNPYGPIGYYLTALCVRLGGVGFTLPRLMILVFALAIALLLFLVIREWTGSGLLGAGFGLYFVFTDPARLWLPLLRVDLLAIALSLTGLWLCLPALAGRAISGPRWLLAAVLFALAIFTKYTALASPAACVLCLAARRDWRRAALLGGTLAALCLVGFAGMQGLTGGQFSFHMFRTHGDPYIFGLLVSFLLMLRPSLAALAPLVLACVLLRPRLSQQALIYLGCAWAVPMVTGGKLGASLNHFLEALAASSIAAAAGYQKLAAFAWTRWLQPLAALSMIAAALYLPGVLLPEGRLGPEGISGCAELYRNVREAPGNEMLSDNIGAVVLAGKTPFISNPFVYAELERERVIPPKPLESAVAARRFGQIVLDTDPASLKGYGTLGWRGPVLTLISQNYRVVKVYDCLNGKYLLEPKPQESSGAGASAAAGSKP